MKKAILKDKTVLGSMLERLSQADEGLLKGVSEQLPAAEVRERQLIILTRLIQSSTATR
jgi:hypothetical protein